MISKEQVQRIADLAHIRLQKQEVEKFQKDFASILEYFEVLNEVDVTGIEPMTHSGKGQRQKRQDIPRNESEETRSKLLSMFPAVQGKLLQVPSVPWQSEKSTNNS